MQSESSQTTPKTKEADRSSPVTDTGNSMARAPTQESASRDARVQPSTNAATSSERIYQRTKSQGQYSARGPREGLVPAVSRLLHSMNQDRGEVRITRETNAETREADVKKCASSQQMNRNIRTTHSGRRDESDRHSSHTRTHDEQGDTSVRGDVGANEVEKGEGELRKVKEAEGNDRSINQCRRASSRGRPGHRRGSAHVPGHQSRNRQTHDERGDANVRKDVDDGGANEGEEGGKERKVEKAEGNELSTNHDLRPSDAPLHDSKRESARDAILRFANHSRYRQTHDERDDVNVREDADDGDPNEGEEGEGGRKVNEAEDNEFSTNQGLRSSNPVRNPHHRREPARAPGHQSRNRQTRDERCDANVREDDGGADEGEGEGEREVKEAGGNEFSTNQDIPPPNPVRRPYNRREPARDVIYRLEGTLRSRQRDVNLLSTRNKELSDEIKIVKEELARLQLERDQTRQLLHERTVELSSAQLFLGKADIISVTDVSRMVDILNAEISQASNSIADSLFDPQVAPATLDQTELNRLLHKGQLSIGPRLCNNLARRLIQPGTEFDPMIAQLALQAGLSKACYNIINDWNPPSWNTSSTVNSIYANMRPKGNGASYCGPMESVDTYLHDSEDGDQEGIREANADYLTSALRDLLTIIGWSSKGPHFPSEYKEKMRFLSDEALKLHETIGRGITSKDLIVEIIPCDTPFDPTKMEDADRQRGKPDAIPDDTVACTVELGLRYNSVKLDSEETGVILKPKVLLASVLTEEEREVTPPKPQN